MAEYKSVYASSIEELDVKVNALAAAGWTLCGNYSTGTRVAGYFATMTKTV